jgi:uncharacterized protein (TIGR02145 family)
MKKIAIVFSFILPLVTIAQVGIGTNTPASSAQLEVSSTSKGYLMPRMTATERNAIVNPANGLQIFNTTTGCINLYKVNAWFEVCGVNLVALYSTGSVFCASGATVIVDVTNPTTGKTWMDRNLGATQLATSATDAAAYGDLYQWGRRSDGHQCRTSATTTILSTTDQPGNGNFVLATSTPNDWRSPQNNNLWQGINGINNPCPTGYYIPSETELNNERLTWSSNNSTGAFLSPLKLTLAGIRDGSDGSLNSLATNSRYWSSTIQGLSSISLTLSSSGSLMSGTSIGRVTGCSVRCIKN